MIGDQTNRHRSRTLLDQSADYERYTYYVGRYGTCTVPPGLPRVASYTGEAWSKYSSETMDDVLTEGFHTLQKRGIIINNPLVKTRTDREWFPGHRNLEVAVQRYGCSPARWYDYSEWQEVGDDSSKAVITQKIGAIPWLAEPVLSAAERTALHELALTSAYARINASDVMALVALAESKKTLVGLLNSFVRVGKIVGNLVSLLKRPDRFYSRSRNLKKFKYDLIELGSNAEKFYMEARYGLRPLYYDVMGLCKFLTKPKQTKDRLTFRGKQIWSRKVSDTQVKALSIGTALYFGANVPFYRTTTKDVYVRAGVLTKFKDYGAIQGLGLDLIPETLWELTKLSFVVDWFINVGELIASLTPNLGFTTLTSWVTQETVVTKTIVAGTPTIVNLSNASYRCVNPSIDVSYGGVETITTRERIPRPKQPTSLHINVKLDALKLLDLAIILKQLKVANGFLKTVRI